jgi:cyclic GMP-AMP synthase DncV-like protein
MEKVTMLNEKEMQLNEVLERITESLDITPSDFKKAEERYKAVGQWLIEGFDKGAFPNSKNEPDVFLQGSMRLGTAVRPLRDGKEADFDIDLVCQFHEEKEEGNHKPIKSQTGKRVKGNADYERMLTAEGKRCWTLEYAEDSKGCGFHLDILPCVIESPTEILNIQLAGGMQKYAIHSIAITNKDKTNNIYSWKPGNPKGYAQWFDEIKQPALNLVLNESRQVIYEKNRDFFASQEEVPQELVKTPLQRVIQILKRHRDMRFAGHELEDCKPISMIITTLAAKIYDSEPDTLSTLQKIINTINAHGTLLENKQLLDASIAAKKLIEKRGGEWWIENPVNPKENFADRWNEINNQRSTAFFQWIEWLMADIASLLQVDNLLECSNKLSGYFGDKSVKNAFSEIGSQHREQRETGKLKIKANGILGVSGATIPGHTFFGD